MRMKGGSHVSYDEAEEEEMIESQPRRVIVEPFTDESEARRCSPA